MKDRTVPYFDGPLRVDWTTDPTLSNNVDSIRVANTGAALGVEPPPAPSPREVKG